METSYPMGVSQDPLAALVFDSLYDPYRGVIIFVRVTDGEIVPGKTLLFLSNGLELVTDDIGYLNPKPVKSDSIKTGEVGYIVTGLKDIHQIDVGDTLTDKLKPTS